MARPPPYTLLFSAMLFLAPAVLGSTAAWDGQYELVGEGPGGVPIHHYLVIYSQGTASRVIVNGKELSHVSLTDAGFSLERSVATRFRGKFLKEQGANAVHLNQDAVPANQLETSGKPLRQTKGASAAGASFKKAKAAMEEYDGFVVRFQAALALPDSECLGALGPLFHLPIHDDRPDLDGQPARNRLIKELTLPFVRSLKAAGHQQKAGRSLQNGPFDYVLFVDHAPGPDFAPFLAVEPCKGKLLITRILYFP